jgi:Raf kinase inhibitor-like YbhB/YbcL family protein
MFVGFGTIAEIRYARAMKRILLGLALVGCNSNSSQTRDAAAVDTPPGTIALTSTAFTEGGAIPMVHTCKDANTSPPLAWTGAPSGTQSFAVVLTDLSLAPHLVHWAIFDIPAAATGLPANIEKVYAPSNVTGAHQVSFQNQTQGYQGPCPPNEHTYEFAVHALDVATLPGATAQTTPAEAVASITTHQLASGTLTGTYTPP